MTKKILITDPLSPAGIEVLKNAGFEVIEILDQDAEKMKVALPEVEGLDNPQWYKNRG